MSEIVLDRLKSLLPQKVMVIDDCEWEVYRFLDFWRYLKYADSQRFVTHYDGSKKLCDEEKGIYEMSIFTINLYLNDGFNGGGTRFYMNRKEICKNFDLEAAGPVTHVVSPKQGSALIFDHCTKGYLHDGEPLDVEKTEVKEKYLLRADLIYKLKEKDIPKLESKIEDGTCKFFKKRVRRLWSS